MRHRLLIAAFVLAAMLVKAPQMLAPMGQDQGLYQGVGELILHGGVPYRDAWDPKPPGVFYTHAAILSLLSDPWRPCALGSLAGLGQSRLQPRCGTLIFEIVDLIYSLLLASLVLILARRFGASPPIAAVAFGLTAIFVNLARIDPEGSTPEKYALAPAVLVILAGLTALRSSQRRWLVIAGVCAALAALFKQPDLASFAALSAWLVWCRRGHDLFWLWTPLAVVLAGAWAFFTTLGAGSQFLDATVAYNLGRLGFEAQSIPLAGAVSAFQVFRDGLAPLLALGALGAVVAWRVRSMRLLAIWAACDVLALCLGGTKFTREYFIQLVPSFSVLGAVAVQHLWTGYARTELGRAWLGLSIATIAVLSSSFQIAFSLRVWNEYVASGWTTTSVEHLGAMVSALPPENTLFVWGDEAQLYPLSHRQPTTRFWNVAGLALNGDAGARQRRAEVIANVTGRPPAVIVVDGRMAEDDRDGRLGLNLRFLPELSQLLADRYRLMDASILGAYVGGDRERVYVRQGGADLCAQMPGCRLS